MNKKMLMLFGMIGSIGLAIGLNLTYHNGSLLLVSFLYVAAMYMLIGWYLGKTDHDGLEYKAALALLQEWVYIPWDDHWPRNLQELHRYILEMKEKIPNGKVLKEIAEYNKPNVQIRIPNLTDHATGRQNAQIILDSILLQINKPAMINTFQRLRTATCRSNQSAYLEIQL